MINQLQLLNRADYIIVVDKGKIIAQGKFGELESQGMDFLKYITKDKTNEKEDDGEKKKRIEEVADKSGDTKQLSGTGQMMAEEELLKGRVKLWTYIRFIKDAFNPVTFIVFLVLLLISEALISFSGYWVGKIGAVTEFEGLSYWWRIGIYALLSVGVFILQAVRVCFGSIGTVRAMRTYHKELLDSVCFGCCCEYYLFGFFFCSILCVGDQMSNVFF
jgi:hypothetical protein